MPDPTPHLSSRCRATPAASRRRGSWPLICRLVWPRLGCHCLTLSLLVAGLLIPGPRTAWAQAQTPPRGIDTAQSDRWERIGRHHLRHIGAVEVELGSGIRFSADQIDYFDDTHRLLATGNVVFISGNSRISADKADFNTRTRTGTFFNAFGSASVSDEVDRSFFGTQEPDAYFYGETIEKLGPDKYRVTKGGFTTCVQPTPRWEVAASSVTLTLDKYAVLSNAVVKVKNVPMLYLPAMYYPIQRDDRATGFLLPLYGQRTYAGSSISNAFFWAIDRSQDMTIMHDWFTKTGQGYGGEYRYVAAPGSEGQLRFYRLDEKAATFTVDGLGTVTQPSRESFELRGNLVQALPKGFRARGSVDYFSDVTVQQQYQMDVYAASLGTRSYAGQVSGALGRGNNLSGSYQISELFYGDTDSQTIGGRPRVTFNRAQTKLGPLPLYALGSAEYVNLARIDRVGAEPNRQEIDYSLTRYDFSPSLLFQLGQLPYLPVRAGITWRNTYWSESLDLRGQQVTEPIFRQFFDMRASVTGPVLTKVWNTPDNGYAERFKHVIEPDFNVQRTTQFEEYDRIVKIEGGDYTLGGTTRLTYGVTNRFLAKRRASAEPNPAARVREFIHVQLQQSYYSDPRASTIDPNYSGGFLGREPSDFSPVALVVRANPTNTLGATARLEYNAQLGEFETIQTTFNLNLEERVVTNLGWSQRKFLYVVDPRLAPPSNFLSSRTNLNFGGGRIGGAYHIDMNLTPTASYPQRLIQQRIAFFYNAQCCGIGLEYQEFNYPNASRFVLPQDRRFNISFTLAGIGTFSNILGAFGIGQGASGVQGGRRF